MFSVFKQYYTYFYTLFTHTYFQKNTNNVTRTTLPNSPFISKTNHPHVCMCFRYYHWYNWERNEIKHNLRWNQIQMKGFSSLRTIIHPKIVHLHLFLIGSLRSVINRDRAFFSSWSQQRPPSLGFCFPFILLVNCVKCGLDLIWRWVFVFFFILLVDFVCGGKMRKMVVHWVLSTTKFIPETIYLLLLWFRGIWFVCWQSPMVEYR